MVLYSFLDASQHIADPTVEKASEDSQNVQNNVDGDYPHLSERQKKLFELGLQMNEARKANQTAMVAEKKKIGKLLDSNGLDMTKAYMLDTQETAETKYKKWEKDPAPSGWDVFSQKTLYNAYKKSTKNIQCDMEAYNKAKEATIQQRLDQNTTLLDDTTTRVDHSLYDVQGKLINMAAQNAYIQQQLHQIMNHLQGQCHILGSSTPTPILSSPSKGGGVITLSPPD